MSFLGIVSLVRMSVRCKVVVVVWVGEYLLEVPRPTNNNNHTNGFNLTTQRYLVDHAFIQGYATSLQPAMIEAIPYDAYKDPNIYSNLHAKLDYYIYTSELLQDKLNRIEEENAELHEKLRVAEIKNIDYEHQLKEHVKNTNPDLLQGLVL